MASIEKDIADYLEDNALGTVGTDIFVSQYTVNAPDEAVMIKQVGGAGQHLYVALQTVDIAFVARSKTFNGAVNKLTAIQSLFDNKTRFSLGVNRKFIMYFYTAEARVDMGRDVNGIVEQVQNYVVRYREYDSYDTI